MDGYVLSCHVEVGEGKGAMASVNIWLEKGRSMF